MSACSQDDFTSHKYGIKQVGFIGARGIYLKRETGLRFDRTSLSLDARRCKGPDDSSDYRLTSLGAGDFPMFYSVDKDGLTVYQNVAQPEATRWPFVVKQKSLNPVVRARIEADYEKRGISKVQISLADVQPCESVY